MPKPEVWQPWISDSHFQALSLNFDRARNIADRLKAGEAIVRFGMEDNFDCMSVLMAMHKGYEALVSPNDKIARAGEAILDGIEDYYQRTIVSNKTLYPFVKRKPAGETLQTKLDSENYERETKELLISIITKRSNAQGPYLGRWPLSLGLVTNLSSKLLGSPVIIGDSVVMVPNPPLAAAGNFVVVPVIVDGRNIAKKSPHNYKDATSIYPKIIQLNYHAVTGDDTEGLKAPEKILDLLRSTASCEGIPAVLKQKWSGISLEEILTENRVEAFAQNAVRYMAALPRGDIFWESVVQGVFLQTQQTHQFDDARVYFQDLELSKRILMIQKWIAEKVIMPAFTGSVQDLGISPHFGELATVDQNFDQLFATIVAKSNPITVAMLGVLLHEIPTYLIGKMRRYKPEKDMTDDALHISPLTEAAFVLFRSQDQDTRVIRIERAVHDFLKQNWSLISQTLDERFGKTSRKSKLKHLKDVLYDAVSVDYNQAETTELLSRMNEYLGEYLLEALNSQKEELRLVTQSKWEEILAIDYWLDPNIFHLITFPQHPNEEDRTLAEILGFESIHFLVNENSREPIDFFIKLRGYAIGIDGKIEPDGQILNLSAILDENFPGLKALIEYMVVATFHDYLLAAKIEIQNEQIATDGDEVQLEKKKKVHKKKAPIAAQATVFEREKATPRITHAVDSDRLINAIKKERKKRNFPWRIVKRHPMTLRGIRDYEALLAEYQAIQIDDQIPETAARREILLAQLERERSELVQPSKDKLKKLPKDLHLRKFLDHTGSEIYAQTWRKRHESPKLTPEQRRSLITRDEAFYKGGSALAFADTEIMGLRYGETDEEELETE